MNKYGRWVLCQDDISGQTKPVFPCSCLRLFKGFSDLPAIKSIYLKKQPFNNLKHRFPWISDAGMRLLNLLLMFDPEKRITARDSIEFSYFKENPLRKSGNVALNNL